MAFLPFLKLQQMCFSTFEIALFSNFRALWTFLSVDFTFFFYFLAVRSGDVGKFDVSRSKYVDQFKSDRTFTLILRLHHNVIKTAIRRISLAYSRISLADVAAKLKLESPKDAEYIIAKVNFFFEQVSGYNVTDWGKIFLSVKNV